MTGATDLTPYEIERNKPIPDYIHGLLQLHIGFLLKSAYKKQYHFLSELALATTPGSTPDICIYPKKKVTRKNTKAKTEEAPITTIEIQSPFQSIETLQEKAWDLYFPMGVKSAWIVIPALKGVQILLPDNTELYFNDGKLKDPFTEIELDIETIFEDID